MGLAGATKYIPPVLAGWPSQQPLGGGSAACKPVYLLLQGAPIHVYIAAALLLTIMRLNLGDCTPEAQSAQHREWLPACCSWPSGCEEGAVSLVRIGEERVGCWHTHAPTPGPQDRASAGTSCTAAEAAQSPPALLPSNFSSVPDARPASYYPHLPRPVWVPRLPTNLPTCQPGLRTRRLANGVGGQLQSALVNPATTVKSGRRVKISPGLGRRQGPRRFFSKVGRHGVHCKCHTQVQLYGVWSAGATRLGHQALPRRPRLARQSRSICQNRAHIAI